MRITVLVDDYPIDSNRLYTEHGLSLYISRYNGREKFLFDLGASDCFARNADSLGLSIADVQKVFLSHAHRDHTGGLTELCRLNPTARIYATPSIFHAFYSLRPSGKYEDISAPFVETLGGLEGGIVYNEGYLDLGCGDFLFSGVKTNEFCSEMNSNLFVRRTDSRESHADELINEFVQDPFEHEQNLVLRTETGSSVLFVGCSHLGIVNIMNRCVELLGTSPDYVVGGFHLSSPSRRNSNSVCFLDKLASRIAGFPTSFFGLHCTGEIGSERFQKKLGERYATLRTGNSIELQ